MINVEFAKRRTPATILTLVSVAEHEVAARQANCRARDTIVAQQMNHSRNAKSAAHDGQLVIISANGEISPQVKIVGVAVLIESECAPTIEKNDCALDRGHLNRAEVSVEDEDG